MPESFSSLAEENASLKARIDELEADLDAKTHVEPIATPDTVEIAREIPDRALDEFTRISRALLAASVERLKVSAEVIDKFAEGASELRSHPSQSFTSLLTSVPRSLLTGVVRAMDHELDAPSRTINKFYETYTAPPPEKAPPKVVIEEKVSVS
jgi:hypothetical protein